MVGQEVLEVLYAPVKAFKKIVENPDFKGVAIVLVLLIASTVATQYVASSKQFLETRLPEDEIWTEETLDQHVWTTNGALSRDDTYYQVGNSSITSSVVTDSSVWLQLMDIDAINCSEGAGYTELFFLINWTNNAGSVPVSGTVKLFSGSTDSYFEQDITSLLGSSGEWTNMTLNIGSGQGWDANNSPDWDNLTGAQFELVWTDSSDLTVNVDGLFFRTFSSTIESGAVYIEILSAIIQAGMTWVIWGGVLIIVAKMFNEDFGKWNDFFVIIGYVFMVTVVTNIITAVAATTLPNLTYILDANATYYYARDPDLWLSSIGYQILTPIMWIGYIWRTALSAVAIRQVKQEITWGKALAISIITFAAWMLLSALGF